MISVPSVLSPRQEYEARRTQSSRDHGGASAARCQYRISRSSQSSTPYSSTRYSFEEKKSGLGSFDPAAFAVLGDATVSPSRGYAERQSRVVRVARWRVTKADWTFAILGCSACGQEQKSKRVFRYFLKTSYSPSTITILCAFFISNSTLTSDSNSFSLLSAVCSLASSSSRIIACLARLSLLCQREYNIASVASTPAALRIEPPCSSPS